MIFPALAVDDFLMPIAATGIAYSLAHRRKSATVILYSPAGPSKVTPSTSLSPKPFNFSSKYWHCAYIHVIATLGLVRDARHPNNDLATNSTFAGRSASRRMYHRYHAAP